MAGCVTICRCSRTCACVGGEVRGCTGVGLQYAESSQGSKSGLGGSSVSKWATRYLFAAGPTFGLGGAYACTNRPLEHLDQLVYVQHDLNLGWTTHVCENRRLEQLHKLVYLQQEGQRDLH